MAKKRDAAALTKNEIREAEVTGYTAEGAGVVRVDGVPVFVPGAAQGDRLRVRIVKSLKSYAFGRIEEILSPSSDRIPGLLRAAGAADPRRGAAGPLPQ